SGQLSGVDTSGLGLGQDSGDIIERIHAPILLLADAATFSARRNPASPAREGRPDQRTAACTPPRHGKPAERVAEPLWAWTSGLPSRPDSRGCWRSSERNLPAGGNQELPGDDQLGHGLLLDAGRGRC